MKVVILYDRVAEEGASLDQEDVLMQAKAVGRALVDLGHEPTERTVSLNLKDLMDGMRRDRAELVFNLVESLEGQGRLIPMAPAVLDSLGIPYTGSPADALYVTSNKLITKRLLSGAGIPTPDSLSMEDAPRRNILLDGPYIIKSVWEHASVGIQDDSVVSVEDSHQLFLEMKGRRRKLGGACFAERYIDGREFNLSILASQKGPMVLPPAEIRFDGYPVGKRKIVGYDAKWEQASFEYHHTRRTFEFAEDEAPLLRRLGEIAKRCWALFGLRGYGRVDFRVDKENRPWVLEINANPCLSPDAGFVAAANRAGIDFKEVVERIMNDAIACLHTE
ncbi:MAG: ATP-grasp domain-containing protein [Desulfobacterales bacterium]|nr:ATP-grasp domain-containing protein [Desulfobacterales bacterium]